MSDENNNDDPTMKSEWSRVMSNPDNLIVSDVLRDALPDEFATEEAVSSILELSISLGNLEVTAPLTRLDMSSNAWLVQATVDTQDVAVILSFTLEEIKTASVELLDKGNTISTFAARESDGLTVSVDTDGRMYFVTLACEKNTPESKDEA